jgi:hypothetical protein
MVALVITVLALSALFSGIADGLVAVKAADLSEQALSRARSRLESLSGSTLTPGVQSGEDGGGFAWQTRITSVAFAQAAAANPRTAARIGLYNVAVIVSWQNRGRTQHVQLDSQRIGVLAP